MEVGSQVEITKDPQELSDVTEFSNTKIFVEASASGTVDYQWQVSDVCDDEDSWVDLKDSPKLMITGVYERKNIYQGVELYAIEDIDDLGDYGLSISNGNATSEQFSLDANINVTELKAGQYLIIYRNTYTDFFSNTAQYPHKSINRGDMWYLFKGNRYNISLWRDKEDNSNQMEKVDVYGDHSQAASGSAWDTEGGWAYRKNGRGPSNVFNIGDWTIAKEAFELVSKNDLATNPYPIFKFTNPQRYVGVNTDTLLIERTPLSFNDLKYRVKVSTPAFACDTVVLSSCSELKVTAMSDTDKDGLPDFIDLDSDNDGIPDKDEGCDIDTDGDGIVNCLDRDSDGDNCDDVIEAGFTDENGDGYLGPEDIYVDINGQVVSGNDGYTSPLDSDGNGILDYLEIGAQPEVVGDPSTVDVILDDDTIFVASAKAPGVITKKWQQSDDDGTNFRTLYNTPDLIITGVLEGARSYERPRIVEFKAIGDINDLENYRLAVFYKDNNNDGASDYNDNPITYDLTSDDTLISGEFFYVVDNYYETTLFLKNYGVDTTGDGLGDFDFSKTKRKQIPNINSTITGTYPIGLQRKDTVTDEWILVDYFGASSDNVSSVEDNYNKGWKYRKDTTQISPNYYRYQDWTICSNCSSTTNRLMDNAFPIGSYGEPVVISGVDTDTLRIENIPASMDGYLYNMEFITKGYLCDTEIFTNQATLKVFQPDFDNDDIVDGLDEDTDNDGILDVDEGTEDLDGDGQPNFKDLDSDGDGCYDVVEAGFEDPDGDGYLGTSPVDVNPANGRVINQGGYSTPPAVDLDGNGIPDFKEAGSGAQFTRKPVNQIYFDETADFHFAASSSSHMFFQWQSLEDTLGTNWEDIAEAGDFSGVTKDTLYIDNVTSYSAYWFRVRIATPAYACQDTIYSDHVKIIGSEDWDNDGIPDNDDFDDDNDGIFFSE